MNTLTLRLSPTATANPLWQAALGFAALFFVCLIVQGFDPRLVNGISGWVKPTKFFASIGLHMATLALGLSLLPQRSPRWLAPTFIACASFEMIYMVFRAARGEASHFNDATAVAAIFYALMGVASIIMMIVTIYAGWLIVRRGEPRNLAFATGLGFILSSILTTLVAGYLAGQGSHWIGGDQTDATGLPILGWSTTGGDIRASHFVSLHLMQIMPIVGLLGSKPLAVVVAIFGSLMTAALFMQALRGIPFVAL